MLPEWGGARGLDASLERQDGLFSATVLRDDRNPGVLASLRHRSIGGSVDHGGR